MIFILTLERKISEKILDVKIICFSKADFDNSKNTCDHTSFHKKNFTENENCGKNLFFETTYSWSLFTILFSTQLRSLILNDISALINEKFLGDQFW